MMKKLLFTLAFAAFSSASFSQVVSTFPFTEDFESWAQCGTGAGSPCVVPTPWLNSLTTDNHDWTVHSGTTGSGSTGPTANGGADHKPGIAGGKYLYYETSSPTATGQTVHLESPWFDFTALTAPVMTYWYHLYGTSMGTIQLDVRNTLAGGGPWTTIVAPITDNQDIWQEQIVSLLAYAGQDSVQVRWHGIRGTSFGSDMAIDDITVFQPADVDLTAISVDSLPASACGLGLSDVWTTIGQVGAIGLIPGDTIYANYSDGTTTINDTILLSAPFLPATVYNHMFSQQADYSLPGTYNITVSVYTLQDPNNIDDTTYATLDNIPIITSLPYTEDFESGTGGWASNGTFSNWEHGVLNQTNVFGSAGCSVGDSLVWATGLSSPYNNNATAYLESPCIDFSSLSVDPYLSFHHIFQVEPSFEDHFVEVSIDGGITWTLLGGLGTGFNWYNQITNWDGVSYASPGEWRKAGHILTGTAGQSSVRLRFVLTSDGSVTMDGIAVDNISIDVASAIVDAKPVSLDSPLSGCGLTSTESIIGTFENIGSDTLIGFDVCYILNAGAPVCETLTDTILPGGTYQHTFAVTADLSTVGLYTIDLNITGGSDFDVCNDTKAFTTQNKPVINTFPYLETFENGPGGWGADNTVNGSWELTTPAGATIIGAASGVNAWVTNPTGLYSPNDNSFVESPCFDFTTLDSGSWVALKVWWNSEFSWDGANLQISLDTAATWTNIGSFGDPDNWYTDNTINGNPGGSQEGWTGRDASGNGSGGWVIAKHPLNNALVGVPHALFRVAFASDGSVQDEGFAFDNFAIGLPPTINIGPDYVGCANYEINPGLPGTYEWSTADTIPLSPETLVSTDPSVIFTNTGSTDTTYNAIVLYIDSLGLCAMDTAMLTLSPAPVVNLGADTTICFDGTALYAVGTAVNYEYLWSDLTTIDSAWFNTGGLIGVTVTDTLSGCSASDSALVTITLAVDIPTTANVCGGDSLLVDAGTYDTYLWSTTESTQTIYVYTPGSYTVIATDTVFGCVSTDSIVITTSLPVPTITGLIDTICAAGSIVLDAGAGFSSYSWTTSGSAQTETILGSSLPLGDNTVTVTVTDGNGCSNTDAVTFNIDGCLGLDDLNGIAMSIYPNPSSGVFTYSIENITGDINMMITDLSGKIIEAGKIKTATGIIDLTNYENGIYILKLQAGNAITSVRLLKL
jgi:hypothetical protein